MVSGSFGMMLFFVCRRNQHFFIRKRLANLCKTGTAGCHIEDPADNGSCFLIYVKGLLITGNPLIPVGNTAAAPFAILHTPGWDVWGNEIKSDIRFAGKEV